jgi:hypothetical protein
LGQFGRDVAPGDAETGRTDREVPMPEAVTKPDPDRERRAALVRKVAEIRFNAIAARAMAFGALSDHVTQVHRFLQELEGELVHAQQTVEDLKANNRRHDNASARVRHIEERRDLVRDVLLPEITTRAQQASDEASSFGTSAEQLLKAAKEDFDYLDLYDAL